MAKNKVLENYTKIAGEVADFKAENQAVFDEYDALLVQLQEAEIALKAEVRDNVKGHLENQFVRVVYSPAFKKSYDLETVLSMITPKQKSKLTELGGIKQEIDRVIFEDCVKNGIIGVEVQQEAFREEEQTPRIIIKENDL